MLSEFNIGFELEAYYVGNLSPELSEDYIKTVIRRYFPEEDDIIIKPENSLPPIILQKQPFSNSDIKETHRICNGFEFASKPYKFTISNIIKILKFLQDLSNHNIIVNEHCGFHIHFSYPRMTKEDAIWIISNLVLDHEKFEDLKKFEGIPFWNKEFADYIVLENLKKYIIKKDFEKVVLTITNDKYRIFRIHPQGTIEWRGPRNFLNLGNDKIKKFLLKLSHLLLLVEKITLSKKILDMSKREYFKSFYRYYYYADDPSLSLTFNSLPKIRKIVRKFEKNSKLFNKIENTRIRRRILDMYPEGLIHLTNPPPALIARYCSHDIKLFESLDSKHQTKQAINSILNLNPHSIVSYYTYLDTRQINRFFKKHTQIWISHEHLMKLFFKRDSTTLWNALYSFFEQTNKPIDTLVPVKSHLVKIIKKNPSLFENIKHPFGRLYPIVYDYDPQLLLDRTNELTHKKDFVRFMKSKGFDIKYKKNN